jgi:hypothetical protein
MAKNMSKNKSNADMWLVALVACVAIIAIVIISKGISFGTGSYSTITGEVTKDLSERCMDSDSGLDYYAAGSISGFMPKKFDAYDRCVSKTVLWETYCNSDNYGSAVQFTCPYGCEANRCKAAD